MAAAGTAVKVWKDGEVSHRIELHKQAKMATWIGLHLLAVADADGLLQVWDLDTNRKVAEMQAKGEIRQIGYGEQIG